MQNRILLLVIVILSIVLIVVSSKNNTTFFNTIANNNIIVKNTTDDSITNMDLEDYIIGVVAGEMPASFEEEALKAQAIAARTYATYKIQTSNKDYDVVTDVSNQSYITIDEMKKKWSNEFDKYYKKIKKAVMDTSGKIMMYDDEVIEAYYFAMSNGYTEKASLVFNENRDYLQSVESVYDNSNLKNFEVSITFTKQDFCQKLNISCSTITIKNIRRSDTNRVNSLIVNDKEFKGTIFRSKLGLRSTDFDIVVTNNNIKITTRGYGHGVGMSQYGANGMAQNGYNYEEILKYYYKNVKITTL